MKNTNKKIDYTDMVAAARKMEKALVLFRCPKGGP